MVAVDCLFCGWGASCGTCGVVISWARGSTLYSSDSVLSTIQVPMRSEHCRPSFGNKKGLEVACRWTELESQEEAEGVIRFVCHQDEVVCLNCNNVESW